MTSGAVKFERNRIDGSYEVTALVRGEWHHVGTVERRSTVPRPWGAWTDLYATPEYFRTMAEAGEWLRRRAAAA